ncbi:hypothetical protein Zmor_003612 [Zophobas morio]|uniref:CCHC-type domain-containing protein n=1 Tax=Zophobas morio TaxID=2755281 RepID=A0AA38HN80_9CUCU|nr:hypothetical protein Zmor_003612 [Zophobas morio]
MVELKKEIVNKIQGVEVRTIEGGKNETLLHLKNIDSDTDEKCIISAIQAKAGNNELRVQVRNLKHSYSEMKTATIAVDPEVAEKFLIGKDIQIGIGHCIIEKKTYIQRCYRCWQIGHTKAECQEPTKENLCRRCGRADHRSNDCNEEEYCLTCNKSGHITSTVGCRKFRKALTKI